MCLRWLVVVFWDGVMREVTVRIRFNQVCPGAHRRPHSGGVIFAMVRDPDGKVMFLPTWWSAILRYAAKVLNRHQQDVDAVRWDPLIDGEPRTWRRPIPTDGKKSNRARYALHEAFLPGASIGVNCVLPSAITIDDFWQLLTVAGTYRGISPYKPSKDFGTFEVVSIDSRGRIVAIEPPVLRVGE